MAASLTIHPRRLLALLGALLLLGMLAGGLRLLQLRRQFEAPVLTEVATGSANWDNRIRLWALDSRLNAYALTPTSDANAAEILWPRGLGQPSLRCPSFMGFMGLGPSHPMWVTERAEWVEAANCEDLEHFLAAAHAGTFDILAVAGDTDSWELILGNRAHDGVRNGLWALIARARLALEQARPQTAEFHLRAAMSLALTLVRWDGNLAGITTGHRALEVALEHFEALEVSRRQLARAAEIRELRAGLPPFESCTSILNHGLPLTAAVAAGRHFVQEAAMNPTIPLAMRVRAAFAIAHSWTGNPWYLLRGPGSSRDAVLSKLLTSPDLQPWVLIITSIPTPTPAERLTALWEMAVAGLPRS
jgi:hypothetical protein